MTGNVCLSLRHHFAKDFVPLAICERGRVIPVGELRNASDIRPWMMTVRRAMQPVAVGAVELAEVNAELHVQSIPASENPTPVATLPAGAAASSAARRTWRD